MSDNTQYVDCPLGRDCPNGSTKHRRGSLVYQEHMKIAQRRNKRSHQDDDPNGNGGQNPFENDYNYEDNNDPTEDHEDTETKPGHPNKIERLAQDVASRKDVDRVEVDKQIIKVNFTNGTSYKATRQEDGTYHVTEIDNNGQEHDQGIKNEEELGEALENISLVGAGALGVAGMHTMGRGQRGRRRRRRRGRKGRDPLDSVLRKYFARFFRIFPGNM